jgi:hypothetical protein
LSGELSQGFGTLAVYHQHAAGSERIPDVSFESVTTPTNQPRTMRIILLPLTVIAFAAVSCNRQEGSTAASASESAVKPFPLDTCLVSGEKLGSMGDPTVIIHEGQEIKFCCDSCVPKFKQAPAKYLSKLDHAGHNH